MTVWVSHAFHSVFFFFCIREISPTEFLIPAQIVPKEIPGGTGLRACPSRPLAGWHRAGHPLQPAGRLFHPEK
jgi:hypothetical protein